MPSLLNVGAGNRPDLPPHYAGWTSLRLDVDPSVGAELVCDARLLKENLPPSSYDAVYCCHNLEHYYPHDGERVLQGFIHVLKPDGFAEIRVPDIEAVMKDAMAKGLDIEDELYASPAGPIRALDVLYGWQPEIARSGHDFYAHKTGFTVKSLARALQRVGFQVLLQAPPIALYELRMLAFRQTPTAAQCRLLGIGD